MKVVFMKYGFREIVHLSLASILLVAFPTSLFAQATPTEVPASTGEQSNLENAQETIENIDRDLTAAGVPPADRITIVGGLRDAASNGVNISSDNVSVSNGNLNFYGATLNPTLMAQRLRDDQKPGADSATSVAQTLVKLETGSREFAANTGISSQQQANVAQVIWNTRGELDHTMISVNPSNGQFQVAGVSIAPTRLVELTNTLQSEGLYVGSFTAEGLKEILRNPTDISDFNIDTDTETITFSIAGTPVTWHYGREEGDGAGSNGTILTRGGNVGIVAGGVSEASGGSNESWGVNRRGADERPDVPASEGDGPAHAEEFVGASSSTPMDANEFASANDQAKVAGSASAAKETSASVVEAIVTSPAPEDNYNPADTDSVGYDSPVFLEPIDKENKKYPSFSFDRGLHGNTNEDSRYISIRQVKNIGLDQEILKADMPLFYSLERMKRSLHNSEHLRDKYVDSYQSVRSVAILTLSHLDKTVGAGLATAENQAQLRTTNNLLKTMNYAIARMSTPRLASVIDDTQEKLVQCMFGETALETTSIEGKTNRYIFSAETAPECGEDPKINWELEANPDSKIALSRYDYCSCVADSSIAPNLATDAYLPVSRSVSNGEYSTVDRLFFGADITSTKHLGQEAHREIIQEIQNLALDFKETYGDIVLTVNKDISDDRQGRGLGRGLIRKIQDPRYSPREMVTYFRDGCVRNDGEPCNKFQEVQGICPALKKILWTFGTDMGDNSLVYESIQKDGNGNPLFKGRQSERRFWYEVASRGGIILTAGSIEAILDLDNLLPKRPLGMDYDFVANGNLATARFIQQYCDNAAIAHFKKVHNRMSVMVRDMLAINTSISDSDKSQLMALVNRVNDYVNLAAADADAHHYVKKLLQSVATTEGRKAIADAASAGVANANRNSNRGHEIDVSGMFSGVGP